VNALPQTGSGAADVTTTAGLFGLASLVTALAGAGLRSGIFGRQIAA
jgi:hypothetical protein